MGASTWMQPRWDAKRVVALTGVFVLHAIVFGFLLLPKRGIEITRPEPTIEPTIVEFMDVQPPPRPAPPPPTPTPAPRAPTTFVPTPIPTAAPIETPEYVAPTMFDDTSVESTSIETAPSETATGPDGSSPSRALALTALYAPPPAYPRREQARGIQGRVDVLVRVGTNGLPMEVRVDRSSGNRNLDRAAQRAIKRWRFQPYAKDGVAVQVWARVPVSFTLAD